MEAKRTPLIELLERVPRDAALVVEHDQFSSSSHPVGRLCHEAAAALEAAREDAERLDYVMRRARGSELRRIGIHTNGGDHRPAIDQARGKGVA